MMGTNTFALLDAADALGLDNPDGSPSTEAERCIDRLAQLLAPDEWQESSDAPDASLIADGVRHLHGLRRVGLAYEVLQELCITLAADMGAIRDGVADGLDGRLLRAWKASGLSLHQCAVSLGVLALGHMTVFDFTDAALVDLFERFVERRLLAKAQAAPASDAEPATKREGP